MKDKDGIHQEWALIKNDTLGLSIKEIVGQMLLKEVKDMNKSIHQHNTKFEGSLDFLLKND